jgi:hypothetical protein
MPLFILQNCSGRKNYNKKNRDKSPSGVSGSSKISTSNVTLPVVAVATKSKVVPAASLASSSFHLPPLPLQPPVLPVDGIKTEHRTALRTDESSVIETSPPVPSETAKKSGVKECGSGGGGASKSHQMASTGVASSAPKQSSSTQVVFKSEPGCVSQADESSSCSSSGGGLCNSKIKGSTVAAAKDNFPRPLLPAPHGRGGGKKSEVRLRPESDILKQSVVQQKQLQLQLGSSSSVCIQRTAPKGSGLRKKKSSTSDKVKTNGWCPQNANYSRAYFTCFHLFLPFLSGKIV